jgi:hypothetical protein
MKKRSRIRRYLLGTLSPREGAKCEDQYFADDSAFEEFVGSENDFIDSYVRGRLSPGEREQFEKRYRRSSEQLARLEFAKALRDVSHGARHAAAGTGSSAAWARIAAWLPAPRTLAWAAGVVLVIAGVFTWLARENHQLRAELERSRVAQAELRQRVQRLQAREATGRQATRPGLESNAVAGANPRGPAPAIMILTLTPGVFRGAETSQQTLVLASGGSWLQLQLAAAPKYAKYEVDLETVEGRRIAHLAGPEIRTSENRGFVVARVAANLILPGDYVVKLSGIGNHGRSEEVEAYSFRVVR